MLNIYISQEAVGKLAGLNQDFATVPYRDALVEVTFIPISGRVRVEGETLKLTTFYRDEMKTDSRIQGQAELTMGTAVQTEDMERSCALLYLIASMCCRYLEDRKLLDTYCAMDEKKEGVAFSLEGEELRVRVVSGRERPDLACTNLYGGIQMSRPYMDEILAHNTLELLTLEQKLQRAQAGDREMMELLAMGFLNGDGNVPRDPDRAMEWFQKLADLGSSVAQFNLGLFYGRGFHLPRDYSLAAAWMKKAADQNEEDARVLGRTYALAADRLPRAQAGEALAQAELSETLMELGSMPEQEDDGKEWQEAFSWARKSADQNCPEGIWALGLCYEHGRGTEEDPARAMELYQRGAELGSPACLHSLGCYYLRGEDVALDEQKGFSLCLQAAQQSYVPAMRTAAYCCQCGTGTEEDMDRAISWYEKAQALDYDPELADRLELYKTIRDQQREN